MNHRAQAEGLVAMANAGLWLKRLQPTPELEALLSTARAALDEGSDEGLEAAVRQLSHYLAENRHEARYETPPPWWRGSARSEAPGAADPLRGQRQSLIALEDACLRGDTAAVQQALANATLPNAWSLCVASSYGHVEVVQLLLSAGADPNPDPSDCPGLGPLVSAVSAGRTDIVRLLLEAGAKPDAPALEGRFPPLVLAAHAGLREMCQLLLEHGAQASRKTAEAKTAADYARVVDGHLAKALDDAAERERGLGG